MWSLLERINWTAPSLVFSSLALSAGDRQGLGGEEAKVGLWG